MAKTSSQSSGCFNILTKADTALDLPANNFSSTVAVTLANDYQIVKFFRQKIDFNRHGASNSHPDPDMKHSTCALGQCSLFVKTPLLTNGYLAKSAMRTEGSGQPSPLPSDTRQNQSQAHLLQKTTYALAATPNGRPTAISLHVPPPPSMPVSCQRAGTQLNLQTHGPREIKQHR